MDSPANPQSPTPVPPWHDSPLEPPPAVQPESSNSVPPPPPPPPQANFDDEPLPTSPTPPIPEPLPSVPPPVSPAPPAEPPPLEPKKEEMVSFKPKKKGGLKTVLAVVVMLLVVASGALGYMFFQQGGLPFNLGKKAEVAPGCEGCQKYCGLNGHCGASNDCACMRDYNSCVFCDWSCCNTQQPQPTPLSKPYDKCSDWGYTDDSGCTADPNCKGPGQEGQCCKDATHFYCCYRDGNCYQGGSTPPGEGSCKDNGNGSITLTGPINDVRVFKMTGANVSCPYSNSNQQTIETVTLDSGVQRTFSLGNECGQIDAVGYCGSCKSGCSPSTPTNTPTPTPRISNTPTPTIPIAHLTCNCSKVEVFKLTDEGLSESATTFNVGDRLSIKVTFRGLAGDVGIRILRNGVKVTDILRSNSSSPYDPRDMVWSTEYEVTQPGDYEIVAFVKDLDGTWK